MADEPDGVHEVWERTAGGSARVALTAAGQLVELAARARQREAGAAEADALQRAREMTARSDAERSFVRYYHAEAADQAVLRARLDPHNCHRLESDVDGHPPPPD